MRLVQTRKPFVVTTDYIGPDRRLIPRSYPAGSAMVVPNSLLAKVENKPEFAATEEAIQLAMKAVNERKISIYTERLMHLSSAILLLAADSDEAGDRGEVVNTMHSINMRLVDRVRGTEHGHVSALCEGLNDLLKNIEGSKAPLKAQERELLSQIPFAIHKGCQEVHNSAALFFDIRDISVQLRNRKARTGPPILEEGFVPGNS